MHFKRIVVVTMIAAMVSGGLATSSIWAAEKSTVGATAKTNGKPGIIAAVNGSDIDLIDFYRELLKVQRAILQTGRPLTCAVLTKLKTEVAEGLVRRELLYQEGKKKVQVTEAEINAEMKKLKDQYGSESDFTNALQALKISPAALKAQVERTLIIQKVIDTQFTSKAAMSDKEIWSYYDRNRESFRQPEQVRASHILIKVDPGSDTAKKAAARKKIEDIRAKLQQKQDFESLARTYSEDTTSAAKSGDLGYIRSGQVLKPVEEVLFLLKTGEVSDIVETNLGYHLIKAVERKPEMTVPFENLKDQLGKLLKQEKGQQEANAYIAKVREKANVQIYLPSDE